MSRAAAKAFARGTLAARGVNTRVVAEGLRTAALARFLRAQERDWEEQAMLYMLVRKADDDGRDD
ncbi:MAG TPA: hypothetical protein VGK74_15395 [Symbiobacteriaceae bacterium]|jgi:hypothetical protein